MKEGTKKPVVITKALLTRLPLYYCYLRDRIGEEEYISSASLATSLNLNPVQVRKDLAAVSRSAGTPRLGFSAHTLLEDLQEFLGYDNENEVFLVGVGGLGRTLLAYEGFTQYGLRIVAGFDVDENLVGLKINGKTIFPMSKLHDLVKRLNVKIGIIAVPKEYAQEVCNTLIKAGILAIWNFAPTHLDVPEHIVVKNENLAASLANLTKQITDKI